MRACVRACVCGCMHACELMCVRFCKYVPMPMCLGPVHDHVCLLIQQICTGAAAAEAAQAQAADTASAAETESTVEETQVLFWVNRHACTHAVFACATHKSLCTRSCRKCRHKCPTRYLRVPWKFKTHGMASMYCCLWIIDELLYLLLCFSV